MANKKKNKKKYGFKIDEIKPEDYIFGASSVPYEELMPDMDWTPIVSKLDKEVQNLNGVETYACVVFTILHCIEILIYKKYGIKKNYAARFLATVVDTKDKGSSPQEVCEFLRKLGIPPEEVLPFDSTINTKEKFFAKVEPKVFEIAREFLAEFDFKHEYVPNNNEAILKALKCSPLGISVAAWHERGSMYYKPEGVRDNHFTTLINTQNGLYKRVWDSYGDNEGDPYLKDYEWDTKHSAIKRFWIQKKAQKKSSFWQKLIELTKNLH